MNKKLVFVVAIASIIAVGTAIVWLYQTRRADYVKSSAQKQFLAAAQNEFAPGILTLRDFHVSGKDGFATVAIAGALVSGQFAVIIDGDAVRTSIDSEFSNAMHQALRQKLLSMTTVGMSDSDGDVYAAFLPKGVDKKKFGFLDGAGTLQENDEYIFGIGCYDRDCSGDADAWTINKNTGQMIVAMMDTGEVPEQNKAEAAVNANPNAPVPPPFKPTTPKFYFYGIPANKEIPAPLFWWITKRSPAGINDNSVALKDDEPIDFSWKYTAYEPDQF